ncbi:hypothetical protein EHQ12_17150 [Leptospira gomenensis]|uniref:BIG2 domain-containing protein n=1 Tax=Leptospira gomenensis TaxID=2484974 RepID=A0A5F1YGD4_9LEPT|nr:Ig-like domain-containing protein [Leptospira gomenensis]TGK33751.1 hypothetical protein EHQ12_17150 [Leptospira gomenensis]TGK38463.1 hypothetical protein EHQ17_02150 [Leptospira gomenensis]TGK42578.1 hypothetical protein EHQ07_14245 [Leptospira gomenensis]TGK55826.1 hypothetical protein EHQ13_16265 [Leptospira gomenensis]
MVFFERKKRNPCRMFYAIFWYSFPLFLFSSCAAWPVFTGAAGLTAGKQGAGVGDALLLFFLGGSNQAELDRVEISAPADSFARGTTLDLRATAVYSDDTHKDITSEASWSSEDQNILRVVTHAQVKGMNLGSGSVGVSFESKNAEATLTVTAATLAELSITCINQGTLLPAGTDRQCSLEGIFSDGSVQVLTNDPDTVWNTTQISVVSIDSNGLANGVAPGTANITASYQGKNASLGISVSAATLSSIEVIPVNGSFPLGKTQQYSATGVYSDQGTQDITSQVSWASLNTGVATVSNTAGSKGFVSTQGTGNATITATLGAINGQSTLTVTSAILTSISITPANPRVVIGRNFNLTATGVFSDGTVADITHQVTWSSLVPSVATVDNSGGSEGKVEGVAAGSTDITAGIGGVDSTVVLQVTDAVLDSIQVIADQTSIARGTSTFLVAIGVYSDGTSQNISDQVAWSSSNSSVLQIANLTSVPKREIQSPVNGSLGTARITAALEAVDYFVEVSVTSAALVAIEVSPTNPSVSVGLTKSFVATGIYSDASTQDLTSQVTWSSSDTAKATISNSNGHRGHATGIAIGNTDIVATLGSISSNASILSITGATLNSIDITPALPNIAVGRNIGLTAMGTYSDGSVSDLTTSVAWTSDDTSIASVDNTIGRQGLTSGISQGIVPIRASLGGVNGSISLNVTAAVLDSIQVTLETTTIAKGTSTRAEARGIFSDGSNLNLSDQVLWSSSSDSVVQIGVLDSGPNRMILLNSPSNGHVGVARITASLSSVSGFADLTVTSPTLVSLQVDPSHRSVSNGLSQNFTATGIYTDGSSQNLTTQVVWASSNTSVAAIDNASGNQGKVTTLQPGAVNITASFGTVVSDPSILTVTAAALTEISIAPTPSLNIAKGLSSNFTATGYYTDGTSENLTSQVVWISSDTSVATASNASGMNGKVTAVQNGTAQISASWGGIQSPNTAVTVSAAVLDSIEISPANFSMAKGNTKRFTATGIYSDTTTLDLTTQVTWTSNDTSKATISNASGTEGYATGMGTGAVTVTATLGGTSGSTVLTITSAVLVSLSVGPTNPFVYTSQTRDFIATGTYSDGSLQNLTTQVTWTSNDSSKATVSNANGTEGRATGISAGNVSITAALGSISGNTDLTVVFLDSTPPTVVNVMPLTPTTIRVTYSEAMNETQAKNAANYKLALTAGLTGSCSDNTNFTTSVSVIAVSSVSGSGSVYVLTLGSAQTSNAGYTLLVDKSGVADLSTAPNSLDCANYGDFLGQEQIKVVSAYCATSNSFVLNFSKAPKTGNNTVGSAECAGSTECGYRYRLTGASDLGAITSAKILDGIVCNGAGADSAKVCVVHNLVQTGAQYSISIANATDGDGFDNSSWGSIRDSLDTENLQSSPRDRASFLGCGTSPVNFSDGPISIDSNASTFGYLADFKSKIYSGPSNTGNGALRFNYDGSSPESIQFAFEKDNISQDGDATNVSSNTAVTRENSIVVPPYPTIGRSGCTANNATLASGCGPDNESGRGVFSTGSLGGDPYLFLAGAKTVPNGFGEYLFDYLYYSSDPSSNVNFKYVDLGSITGSLTAGTSSLVVLNDRVFAGFAKSSNDGIGLFGGLNAPDFGFVTFNVSDAALGFCTAGSNCDAFDGSKGRRIRIDFLPYFGGPSTGILGANNNSHPNWAYYIGVDSLFTFKNRIYAANGGLHAVGHNGSIIRSTSADPTTACSGANTCAAWTEIGPRNNSKWHNSPTNNFFSLELNKFYDLIPGDRAFAQFAEFNGNLYVTRNVCVQSSQASGIRSAPGNVTGCTDGTNTNRRAQLWKCDPTISSNATECDALDWSVVGDDGGGITNMGDSTNRTITMVVKNGSYLYIGYDHPAGIRIYRTNAVNPGSSSSSWTQVAGNGLTDATNIQQIFSAVSVPSGGIHYLYVSAGKNGVPVRTYRQQN